MHLLSHDVSVRVGTVIRMNLFDLPYPSVLVAAGSVTVIAGNCCSARSSKTLLKTCSRVTSRYCLSQLPKSGFWHFAFVFASCAMREVYCHLYLGKEETILCWRTEKIQWVCWQSCPLLMNTLGQSGDHWFILQTFLNCETMEILDAHFNFLLYLGDFGFAFISWWRFRNLETCTAWEEAIWERDRQMVEKWVRITVSQTHLWLKTSC